MAIFGRRSRLVLTLSVLSFVVTSCGSGEEKHVPGASRVDSKFTGEQLYTQYCVNCHGSKGDLGINGATDLTQSVKNTEEKMEFISKGSGDGIMQAYDRSLGGPLNEKEIKLVADYIDSFVR